MFLSEINVYPIKSLAGISVKSSKVTERGLQFDRRWMVIDEKNNFLTQRDFPLMATVGVKILENALLIFSDGKEKTVSFEPGTDETASVKIWSGRCRARIYERAVNDWFASVLDTDCKLVLMPEETRRKVNYFYAAHPTDIVSFADGYPFLLTGAASLEDLNARLADPVPMNRFRPNFVVSGADAFAEDNWRQIKIGSTVFHVVKPCGRCAITTIDQTSGEKHSNEPLKTLASYRIPKRSVKKKIMFGQNLIAEAAGKAVRVGDKIEVIQTKKSVSPGSGNYSLT